MDTDFNINFNDKKLNQAYKNYIINKSAYENNTELISKEISRLTDKLKEVSNKCETLYKQSADNVVTKKYALGGSLLSRGYLCPSPIYDIVTGNCSRGRIINNYPKSKKPTYEYGFDKNGDLIIANNLELNQHEFLLYDKNIILGIVFEYSQEQECEVLLINECEYDKNGRIVAYNKGECTDNSISFLTTEKYSYDEQGLKETEIWEIAVDNNKPIANYTKYVFEHDTNGYLSSYTVEPSMFEDNTFKITIKRKV